MIYAISDLHLSFQTDKPLTDEVGHMLGDVKRTKPMNLFGEKWDNYEQRIRQDWNARVGERDTVIVAGDISWAMRMEETQKDFEYLKSLKGFKIIIRGNHDYWWKSITKIRESLAPDGYALQNDCITRDGVTFAGTRGWRVPERRQTQTPEDKKIYDREIIRLELALKDARSRGANAPIIAILHYPPFNATFDDSPFTALMEKYNVRICVYGHLHGNKTGRVKPHLIKNGVEYYLTSCDLIDYKLVHIAL
jgi:predicted phosphohydrolase